MSARELGKSQRREDILAAARQLMRRGGDDGFSMRSLALEAGVSIATPYNLFGSKQAILLALLDDDLTDYQRSLSELTADEIDVLFESQSLVSRLLRRDPEFYRGVIAAVNRDGPEFRFMARGPRYSLWKQLLRQATERGLLSDTVDPDAFAITTSQLVLGNVLEWAQGGLDLDEMEARSHYGLALTLLAIATESSRPALTAHLHDAERTLQRLWRSRLAARLRDGDLDDETRALLADQLKHLDTLDAQDAQDAKKEREEQP